MWGELHRTVLCISPQRCCVLHRTERSCVMHRTVERIAPHARMYYVLRRTFAMHCTGRCYVFPRTVVYIAPHWIKYCAEPNSPREFNRTIVPVCITPNGIMYCTARYYVLHCTVLLYCTARYCYDLVLLVVLYHLGHKRPSAGMYSTSALTRT